MKKLKMLIGYIFIMICCLLYCKWTYDKLVIVLLQTLILSIFMYSILCLAKLVKFLDINNTLKNNNISYLIYFMFFGIILCSILMTYLLLCTKNIEYSIFYLPVITSYHACGMFCDIVKK